MLKQLSLAGAAALPARFQPLQHVSLYKFCFTSSFQRQTRTGKLIGGGHMLFLSISYLPHGCTQSRVVFGNGCLPLVALADEQVLLLCFAISEPVAPVLMRGRQCLLMEEKNMRGWTRGQSVMTVVSNPDWASRFVGSRTARTEDQFPDHKYLSHSSSVKIEWIPCCLNHQPRIIAELMIKKKAEPEARESEMVRSKILNIRHDEIYSVSWRAVAFVYFLLQEYVWPSDVTFSSSQDWSLIPASEVELFKKHRIPGVRVQSITSTRLWRKWRSIWDIREMGLEPARRELTILSHHFPATLAVDLAASLRHKIGASST
jgi:hypothetical protein